MSRTFDTKKQARQWLERERAALAGGVDPRAGRARVHDLLPVWLDVRRTTVAKTTYRTDVALSKLLPSTLSALPVNRVAEREIHRVYVRLLEKGYAYVSVCRFRASLSAFFAWCVNERMIMINPVVNTKVPKSSALATSINPFTESELEAVYHDAVNLDPWLAEIVLVLGWTGCRWSELKALQPADFVEHPHPALLVRRAQPDGVDLKATKSRQSRWVPVSDRILPIVRDRVGYGHPWLFTTSNGSQLNGSNFRRDIWNTVNRGRRVHDLRHTAACLWLTRGVDVATVSTWLGHSSLNITYIYVRHLGTSADHAALQRLNFDLGCAGGAEADETSDGD